MAFEEVVKQVAGTIQPDGRVRTVFGEAVKLEHHTIVPVASVMGAGGVGGAERLGAERPFSGGVGLGVDVRPVGYIYEQGDDVVFAPIHVDVRNRPLWSEAAFGLRRAVELATSVVTAFLGKRLAQKPPAVVLAIEDADNVRSPS